MPKFKFNGLEEYIIKLERLSRDSEKYIERAVYEGAKVVADQTKSALEQLSTDDTRSTRNNPKIKKSISTIQKKGLIEGFGVSSFDNKNGFINVKTGFQGINKIGQANVTIARRLESGTSWMQKNPVILRASRKARTQCLNAIQKSLNESINNLMR